MDKLLSGTTSIPTDRYGSSTSMYPSTTAAAAVAVDVVVCLCSNVVNVILSLTVWNKIKNLYFNDGIHFSGKNNDCSLNFFRCLYHSI